MVDMLITGLNYIISALGTVLSFILGVLPGSPFGFLMSIDFSGYTGLLTWLIPIGAIIATFEAWLAAILIYYGYQIVMRWVKMLG